MAVQRTSNMVKPVEMTCDVHVCADGVSSVSYSSHLHPCSLLSHLCLTHLHIRFTLARTHLYDAHAPHHARCVGLTLRRHTHTLANAKHNMKCPA